MANNSQASLPDPPAQLKAIQSYMRIAKDIERVDPVVGYWLRLFSTESALKIDKDSPDCKHFLISLLSWLEKFKQSHKDNEAVNNQTVGQAHYENFVMALFNKADTLDRNGSADKNIVRMFFMASILFEAMSVFGSLTEEVTQRAKYAKFKAAYIQKCLKTGQTPKPGPIEGADLEAPGDAASSQDNAQAPTLTPSGTTFPQMPMPPGGAASNYGMPTTGLGQNTTQGGLDIPEVPKDSFVDNHGPSAGVTPPVDPYILTPSEPPSKSNSTATNAPTMPSIDQPADTSLVDSGIKATNGVPLGPEHIIKGQKYCKFASSALQYDDVATAVANLQKALQLLTTGKSPE